MVAEVLPTQSKKIETVIRKTKSASFVLRDNSNVDLSIGRTVLKGELENRSIKWLKFRTFKFE